jgi:3-deoxy-manno-octulosonate cytidylyltransferase (CMP-KDO synthetase)
MKSVIIIPARWDSTRLPGKPLADINGKPMIQWVYEACKKSDVDDVFVATDSVKVFDNVIQFGGSAIMTGVCKTGTERVIEATDKLFNKYEFIVNVQGDEPTINPDDINSILSLLKQEPQSVATLVSRISERERRDRNVVKAFTQKNKITMFTRSPLYADSLNFFRHLGTYGFSNATLKKIKSLSSETQNEKAESLEQLRWADEGILFTYKLTESLFKGVDTIEDLNNIKHLLK